jgi:hypothetical protein
MERQHRFATLRKQTIPGGGPGARARVRWPTRAASALVLIVQSACLAVSHGVYVLTAPAAPAEIVIEFPALEVHPTTAEGHGPQPEPLWTIAPMSGWIHGFTIELTDANGDTLPSDILHHVKVMTPGKRELFNPIMLRLVGAGSETRAAGVPRSLGFPIEVGDSLLATAMVHNDLGLHFEGVRLRVRLHMTAGARNTSPTIVYPFFLHVTPAEGHSEFDLPPGRSVKTWDASPAVGGEVVGFGGHSHRYAVELRFEDLTAGRVLWRAPITTDSTGYIVDVPRKVYRTTRGPTLYPDRTYRLTAIYENPTQDTLRGAGMATLGGMLRPHGSWPEVDRHDPLYLVDRARELNDGGHGHHSAAR